MNARQPSSGVRGPLPTLWTMVHRADDDQWRQLKAFSGVYGKGSRQFQLLEFLRTQPTYNPEEEKAAFGAVEIYSLRKNARKWLIRTARRLGFYAIEVEDQLGEVIVLQGWGHHEEAFQYLNQAKELATTQENFWVLSALIEQEKKIVKELFQGDDRTKHFQRILQEEERNHQHLGTALAISRHLTHHLEPVRNKLAATGVLDHEAVAAYFQSEAYHLPVASLPITLQIEKLTMDEFFFYVAGQYNKAAAVANEVIRLLKENQWMKERFPDKLPRLFMNLAAYHARMQSKEMALDVLARFEAESPLSDKNREQYLLRYVYVHFQLAIDCNLPILIERGMDVWEAHREFIMTLPFDTLKAVILLSVSWHHLSLGQIDQAGDIYQKIDSPPMSMPRLLYQSMMALLHLTLLFEDEDDVGLESIGLQYRRKLRAILPADAPAMTVIAALRSPGNLNDPATRKKSFTQLAATLRKQQGQDDTERSLWFDPIIEWIEHKITATKHP